MKKSDWGPHHGLAATGSAMVPRTAAMAVAIGLARSSVAAMVFVSGAVMVHPMVEMAAIMVPMVPVVIPAVAAPAAVIVPVRR